MFFSEYQRLAMRTANIDPARPKNSLANWGLGVAGEAGEVADLLKKHVFHGHELDKEKLKLELGDVMYYLAAICGTVGLQLGDVAAANIQKLEKRYPQGWSEEASRNRVDTKGE